MRSVWMTVKVIGISLVALTAAVVAYVLWTDRPRHKPRFPKAAH